MPGAPLAIAVNGRDRRHDDEPSSRIGASRFAALVPETVFREGRNDVEVFLVATHGGRAAAHATGRDGNEARYALSADERSVVLPGGERVPARCRPARRAGRVVDRRGRDGPDQGLGGGRPRTSRGSIAS